VGFVPGDQSEKLQISARQNCRCQVSLCRSVSWCLSRGGFSSPLREPGVDQVCEDRTCPRRTFLTNRGLTATISNRQTIGGKRAGGYPVTLGHRAPALIWSRNASALSDAPFLAGMQRRQSSPGAFDKAV